MDDLTHGAYGLQVNIKALIPAPVPLPNVLSITVVGDFTFSYPCKSYSVSKLQISDGSSLFLLVIYSTILVS